MSEQDADAEEPPAEESTADSSEETDADVDESPSEAVSEESGAGDPPDEAVEEVESFAEAPESDADDALSAIVGESDVERGAESTPDVAVPSPEDVEVDVEILEQMERSTPETAARAVAMLRSRVEALESQLGTREEEVEDLESRLKRKQADFQNYKKRQKKRLEQEKELATEDLVERLLDVRDNLKRALEQEEGTDIRSGVESTLQQFDEQLERENVEPIEPDPGEDVDPKRHEALATIASDQPADTVAEVHRPGYVMADKVIRPAQVAISDGSEHEE